MGSARIVPWVVCAGALMGGVVARGAQPDDREPVRPMAPSAEPKPAPEKKTEKPKANPPGTGGVPEPLHPIITEILFAVPVGEAGDANQDGTRHVSGDEFVEVHNPHDKAVQLLGYVITDGNSGSGKGGAGGLRFVFPAFELPAHGTVVVFNGNSASWAGPVGDAKSAPTKGHEKFGNGFVFTMRQTSQRAAFGNASDAAVLRSPDGKIVHRVRWGKAAESAPDAKIVLDEVAPVVSKSSVTRTGAEKGGAWRAHTEVEVRPFSPGVFVEEKKEEEKPAEKKVGS